MKTFNELTLPPYIEATLRKQGFLTATPIQEQLIPTALKGRDLIGRAPAGTGKTIAYLVPLLTALKLDDKSVQGLILTPTRELANQIYQIIQLFQQEDPRLEVQLLTGGRDKERMKERSLPHLLIGTPGRLHDLFIEESIYSLRTVTTVVLDEVDMIVDQGFIEMVKAILKMIGKDHQTIAVSSTLSQAHEKTIRSLMKDPLLVEVTPTVESQEASPHMAIAMKHLSKENALKQLLPLINPFVCFIFASQKTTVDRVYKMMKESNFLVAYLHGDMDDSERRIMIKRIFNHEFTYVVASDIAARGLDLEGVTHVIHLDFPRDLDFYFHRSGRTGRLGGSQGVVYAFYSEADLGVIKKLKNRGIVFNFQVIKQGQIMDAAAAKNVHKRIPDELNKEIRKVVQKHKNGLVKPGYKKKISKEIDKLKRKHRREIIRKDIKRQIKERAILKSKEVKGEE